MAERLTALEVARAAEWFAMAVNYPYSRASGLPPVPGASVERWLDDPDGLLEARDPVEYTGLFDIGKPEPPVPLMESHYHQDKQARLRKVVSFYRAYGVMNHSEFSPDHLCVELAYLAHLAYLAADYPHRDDLVNAYVSFARVHPGSWIGKCAAALRAESPDSVFTILFSALERFLADAAGSDEAVLPLPAGRHAELSQ